MTESQMEVIIDAICALVEYNAVAETRRCDLVDKLTKNFYEAGCVIPDEEW